MSSPEPICGPKWLEKSGRICALLLILLALVAVVGLVAAKIKLVVVPLLVAVIFASLLRPPARFLERHRVPRSLAALLSVLGVLLLLAGAVTLVVPKIMQELSTVGAQIVQQGRDLLQNVVKRTPVSWDDVNQAMASGRSHVEERGGKIASGVMSGAWTFFEVVVGFFLTLVLVFFFVRDGHRLKEWLLRRVAGRHREEVDRGVEAGIGTLRKYIGGVSVVAAVDALGIGLGLWIIGVPLVLPLAVLTFVASYLPIIGAVSAGLVACIVALVTGGVTDALLTLAVVLAVQQLESNVLEPVVLGRALPLHPVVVILSLSAGAIVAGIPGAFLAVPLTAFTVASLEAARAHRSEGTPAA